MFVPQYYFAVALLLAGLGFLQFHSLTCRKLAILCFCLATGQAVWGFTGQWWLGVLALLGWVLLPVFELMLVLPRLRLPRHRELHDGVPPLDEFPGLRQLTIEIEELGFRRVADCDISPANPEQFYRMFAHETEKIYGCIGWVANGAEGFHFVSFSSEEAGGTLWSTCDYPLSLGLARPPNVRTYRLVRAESPEILLQGHRDFLAINAVPPEQLVFSPEAEAMREKIEKTMAAEMDYNCRMGILVVDQDQSESFRYSWRGFFYVVSQVLRDFVRM